jgi:hypothetical protein
MAELDPTIPLSLIPLIGEPITPDEQLEVAVLSALGGAVEVPAVEPVSYGRSWMINPQKGGFAKRGPEPTSVGGYEALQAWALMALYSARFVHRVFSDDFGVEGIKESIGKLGSDIITQRIRASIERALLQHERVSSIQDLDVSWDATEGYILISRFTMVTDDEYHVNFSDILLQET